MKVCTQCKEEKKSGEFYTHKGRKDGLSSWCRQCTCEKVRVYRLLNPEKEKATREKRKEKSLEKAREYKQKHKSRLKVQSDLYYLKNCESLKKKSRDYAKLNSEAISKRNKKYHEVWKNTESAKEYFKKTGPETKIKYAKQRKASQMVTNAVRDGRLHKPLHCTLCLSEEKVEGHHPDYTKPLEVVWVCNKCHRAIHKSLKDR